jgi:hypothetical protein
MTWLTIRDIQKRLGISQPDTVLRLIRLGHLKAINLSANPAGRATWRIRPEDFAAFLTARTYVPLSVTTRRARKVKTEPVPEYV